MKIRLAVANIPPSIDEDAQEQDTGSASGKTNGKDNNTTNFVSKDQFQPATD